MKREINVFDHASEIMTRLKEGVLLNVQLGDKVNSMVISWGMLGIEWGKPVFITFVRESRFTKTILDQTMEFTISIPNERLPRDIMKVCGTLSGRTMDKIDQLGLTLEPALEINTPGIKEVPLTLECKVLFKQVQTEDLMLFDTIDQMYPKDSNTGARDIHTAYYGEILKSYIIE